MDDCYFVLRLRNNEAASIICGPVAEAYHAFTMASMDDDDGAVIVLPSNVVSDLLSRCGVLV